MNSVTAYLYDSSLSEPKKERLLLRLETELARNGLSGMILRIGGFRKAKDLVKEAQQKGVTTFVIVGGDALVHEILPLLLESPFVIGYIPIESSRIAKQLSVPMVLDQSIECLRARFIRSVDIGVISQIPFLSEVLIPAKHINWLMGDYTLKTDQESTMQLSINQGFAPSAQITCSLTIHPKQQGWSFKSKKPTKPTTVTVSRVEFTVKKPLKACVDGLMKEANSGEVTVKKGGLKWIVGRRLATGKEV